MQEQNREIPERIRNVVTCYDVAEANGLTLKSSGQTWITSVRNERTPSLHIYKDPSRGWYDYGDDGAVTQYGSDCIGLWWYIRGGEFRDVLLEMGKQFHISIDNDELQGWTRTAETRKEKLLSTHGKARQIAELLADKERKKADSFAEPEVGTPSLENARMLDAVSEMELTGDILEDDHTVGVMLSGIRLYGGESGKADADNLEQELYGIDPQEGSTQAVTMKTADQYAGSPMRFIWYPFIPCGEYSIMAAAGGSGKGMCACLIASYISTGTPLPEDRPCPDSLRAIPWHEPRNVLFISSEDTGDQIRSRLGVSHADLKRVFLIPKDEACGLDFSTETGLGVLKKLINDSAASLVIIDPVQAFIGGETDMNRAAKMRTILSGISHVAGEMQCGILLIAHTSKKAQDMDLNGGILGSVETVNAARSVMCIMRDPEDENPFTAKRLILHTKVNNARLARSVRFEIHEESRIINGEKVIEAGGRFAPADELYSDITKELFEESVRRKVSARELLALKRHEESEFDELTNVIREKADELRKNHKASAQYCYEEFDGYIWAGKRPADAIGRVAFKVIGDGIAVKAGVLIKKTIDGRAKQSRGFKITLTK